MVKYKFTLSIGYPTAKRSEIIELDDDMSEEEIEEVWIEWCNNFIDGGWSKL